MGSMNAMGNLGGSGGMAGSLALFLAGAAIGGLLVALNTPRTGPELQEDLKAMARRARRKARDLAQEAHGAWDEFKGRAEKTGAAVREDLKRGLEDREPR
jgi:gas vesicle protein